MRYIAAWMIAVLLMCTVISCTGLAAELVHSQQKPAPPCHQQHKPAPPQTGASCDHQQAVTTDGISMPVPDAAWLPLAASIHPVEGSLSRLGPQVFRESPPGPKVPSSILRI